MSMSSQRLLPLGVLTPQVSVCGWGGGRVATATMMRTVSRSVHQVSLILWQALLPHSLMARQGHIRRKQHSGVSMRHKSHSRCPRGCCM